MNAGRAAGARTPLSGMGLRARRSDLSYAGSNRDEPGRPHGRPSAHHHDRSPCLGYVPLSQTGSELLFDVFSRRYENGATIVTSNLSFQEWTSVFASERLTGALLDRITHHVHILEMNADSYRLKQSRSRRQRPSE